MSLSQGSAMLTHAHPRLLSLGPALDVRNTLRGAVTRLREAMCGIGGHEYSVRATRNRIFMQCIACGCETPGWRLEPKTRLSTMTFGADRPRNRTLPDGAPAKRGIREANR